MEGGRVESVGRGTVKTNLSGFQCRLDTTAYILKCVVFRFVSKFVSQFRIPYLIQRDITYIYILYLTLNKLNQSH